MTITGSGGETVVRAIISLKLQAPKKLIRWNQIVTSGNGDWVPITWPGRAVSRDGPVDYDANQIPGSMKNYIWDLIFPMVKQYFKLLN